MPDEASSACTTARNDSDAGVACTTARSDSDTGAAAAVAAVDISNGDSDRLVNVSCLRIQFRLRLTKEFRGKPLNVAVVQPFIKAYNKKTKHSFDVKKLDPQQLEKLVVDGEELPFGQIYNRPADSVLVRDGMKVEISFYNNKPVKMPTEPPPEPVGPYAALLKKVKTHRVEDVVGASELAWSSKNLTADDMKAFAAMLQEHGPAQKLANLYFYDNMIVRLPEAARTRALAPDTLCGADRETTGSSRSPRC